MSTKETSTNTSATTAACQELTENELDSVTGGLVIQAILVPPPALPPLRPESDLTRDQLQQVAAGNPLPRPR